MSSRRYESTARARDDCAAVIEQVSHGGEVCAKIDLAYRNAQERISVRTVSGDSERGGTRAVTEAEDRVEDQRVSRQAERDLETMKSNPRDIERLSSELVMAVQRQSQIIDHDKLPKAQEHPQCQSCERSEYVKGIKRGDHFAEVRADVKGHGLCDWCYRHALAAAKEAGEPLGRQHWPSIEVCDVRERMGPRAAGVLLAKQRRGAA